MEPAAKLLPPIETTQGNWRKPLKFLQIPLPGPSCTQMATEESCAIGGRARRLEQQVLELLIPKDPRDEKNLLSGNPRRNRRG